MLASVKEGLYHPMLPTFRRMDMDTAMHKLPEEHSRTTTPLTRSKEKSILHVAHQILLLLLLVFNISISIFISDDFKNSSITLFKPADRPLSGTVSRYRNAEDEVIEVRGPFLESPENFTGPKSHS